MTTPIRLIVWGLLLTISVTVLAAQPISEPYCAVELRVQSPSHEALQRMPVVMLSSDGASEDRTTTDENGLARFCNPKMNSLHEIRVGRSKCWVEIHEVHPVWRKPLRLEVIYDQCEQSRIVGFCDVVVHLQDRNGHPLVGIDFGISADVSAAVLRWTPKSDEFGRIFATVLWHQRARGIVRRPGGSIFEVISLDCNDEVKEWTMVLEEKKK
jgi:hypothetical protein